MAESIHLGGELLAAQALALALDGCSELALALGGGLLVELAGAQFGEQADFFDGTLEAAQGDIKRLEGLGAQRLEGPINMANGGRIAFLRGPDDTRLELVQAPRKGKDPC